MLDVYLYATLAIISSDPGHTGTACGDVASMSASCSLAEGERVPKLLPRVLLAESSADREGGCLADQPRGGGCATMAQSVGW